MKRQIIITIKPKKETQFKNQVISALDYFKEQQHYYPDMTIEDLRIQEETILS